METLKDNGKESECHSKHMARKNIKKINYKEYIRNEEVRRYKHKSVTLARDEE